MTDILDQKLVDPKSTQIEVHLTQTDPTRPEMLPNPKHVPTQT